MPITLSYDLKGATGNQQNYVRSMFERFGWRRLGGSVLRYDGRKTDGGLQEDWLNDVAPAIMLFRSFILKNNMTIGFFTLDSMSITRVETEFGNMPVDGASLSLNVPTNNQSSERALKKFVTQSTKAAPSSE